MFFKIHVLKKFAHRKITVSESLFHKVPGAAVDVFP